MTCAADRDLLARVAVVNRQLGHAVVTMFDDPGYDDGALPPDPLQTLGTILHRLAVDMIVRANEIRAMRTPIPPPPASDPDPLRGVVTQ